jgi:putative phosphoesterase
MRIGVVSDTHNNLTNCRKIVALFNEAEVDLVIHTGDVTQAKTIDVFGELSMPMIGVFGNNDVERESLEPAIARAGFEFFNPPYECELAEKSICIVHDPLEFPEGYQSRFDVSLHGHTHRFLYEKSESHLAFNPGECAGMMKGLNAIGIVDLVQMNAEVIKF